MQDDSQNKQKPKFPEVSSFENSFDSLEELEEKDLIDNLPDDFDEEQKRFNDKKLATAPNDHLGSTDGLADLEITDSDEKPAAKQVTADTAATLSSGDLSELIKGGDPLKITAHLVKLQNAKEARDAINQILVANPENVIEILRAAGATNSYATGPALCELWQPEFIKSRWQSGDLFDLFKDGKCSANDLVSAIDYSDCKAGQKPLADFFSSLPADSNRKESLAIAFVQKDNFLPGFKYNSVDAVARRAAIDFLATRNSPESINALRSVLDVNDKVSVEQVEKLLTQKWTTEKQNATGKEAASELLVADRLKRSVDDLLQVRWPDDENVKELRHASQLARKLLMDSAHKLASEMSGADLEEVRSAAEATARYESVMNARAKALGEKLAPFCKELGIPTPQIKFFEPEIINYNGFHCSGSNEISINTNLVMEGTAPGSQLASTLFHELGHQEQDFLIVKRIADQLNIGKNVSPQDLSRVREQYQKQQEVTRVDERFLEEVLVKRDGVRLNESETLRADKLVESFAEHRDSIAKRQELLATAQLMHDRADRLTGEVPLSILVSPEDPIASAKKYLDTQTLSPELTQALNEWKSSSANQTHEEKIALESGILGQMEGECRSRAYLAESESDKHYRQLFHEVESWEIGGRASLFAGQHRMINMAKQASDDAKTGKRGENTADKPVPVSDAKVPAIAQSLPDLLKDGAVGPIKDYVVGLQNFEEARKAIATITETRPENVLEILREIAKSDSHATGPAISDLLSLDEIDSDNTLVEERWKSGELAKLFESNKLSGANFLGAIACTNSAEGRQYIDKYFGSLNINSQTKEKLAITILTKNSFMPGFEFDMIKPETRFQAIEFLATRETPEAAKVLSRMLVEKEKGIAEAAEKALSKKWTTQGNLDSAGESRNAFAVGDRLQRFTRDLSGKPWNDGQNFAEIESEYKAHKLVLDESARKLAVKLGRGDTERELEIEKRIDDKSFMEDLIKRRPNAKPLYDQYLQEKVESAPAVDQYNSLLAARAKDLQAKIDPYCKELGIPTPKVEFFPPEGTTFRGSHQNGSDTIALNTSLMKDGTISSDMVSTIFHEVGHHEQSQQVARMLADELKLGKNATPEDVQKLKAEFESRHGNRFEGQSEFFEDVLKLRNGEQLNLQENLRAIKLLNSFVDHYEAGERQTALNERAERMSDRAQRFKSPIPLFVLMSGKDPIAEAKRALETEILPPALEKDLQKWKDVGAKFSPESEEIETKVRDGMHLALLRDASYSSREAHKQYRDRFHEVETWDISARSKLFGGAHKSDIMARSQSEAIVASKPKAEQAPQAKRPTASEIEIGHLVRAGDFEKLKTFLETTTSAESAKLGVWKMTAAKPANLLEKLRTIGSGDSYAAGPAMAALGLQSDDAKDMSYLKEQHQSGRLLEMLKSQKLTAADYVSIIDYSGSEFCQKESAVLLDKLTPSPALKTEIAKQLLAMDNHGKTLYKHEWVTPETRMKAMAHLISSGEEGLKIVKELTLSESLEVSKLAKNAIREAWTTGKPIDGVGAANNELVTGDRLRRFTEDLANRSWQDSTKISDLLVEHDKAFQEFEKRGEALARKILGPGTDRETRFDLISELFLESKRNEILGKHPELKAEYDRFLKAQEQYESVEKRFRDLTTKRGQALEAHLNQYCKEMGITTPKIRFYNPLGGDNVDGVSVNGRGRISLSAALMGDSKSPTADFLNTLFHEVGHQEQDNLIIRRLADELKIGKTATQEQFDALRKLYAKREGGGEKPSKAYLEEVLDVRDGQKLNEAQSQRADKLLESYRSLQEFSARERSLEARIQRYDKVSKALSEGASLEKLVGTRDPVVGAERLLKTKKIPADLATALKAWGDAATSKAADIPALEANVRQMLIERCAERKRVASNESFNAYRGRLHEIEAWDVGARAGFFSREAIEKHAASGKALEPMLAALPEKPIDWLGKRAEKPSDLAKRNRNGTAETARNSQESPYLSHSEKAAASALRHTIDNGLQIVGEKISFVDGVHKLNQPIKLDLGGKPLTIVAIEYKEGEIYLKDGTDGKRYRAKPWIDALSEGLAHNVESEGASIERVSSSKQTLQMMQTSVEAKIAMVRALAETYAKNSLPPAKDVSLKQPESIAREGNSTGESTALRPGSMGGDVRKTAAGGYEVTEKVGEKAHSSSNFEGVPREEIARLREEIINDKSGKMSAQEKADSLRVLELAEQGDLRAKDAVRRAYGDAARNDGRFDRAAGRLVAIGMVVSTLAGWYAYSRMQSVQPSETQKAKIR